MQNDQLARSRQFKSLELLPFLIGVAGVWWMAGLVATAPARSAFAPLVIFGCGVGTLAAWWWAVHRTRLVLARLERELGQSRRDVEALREANHKLAHELKERSEDLKLAVTDSDRRFRAMADNAPMMIWMSGTDSRCNFLSKKWLDFTGRSLLQELANGWAEGVHPEDCEHCNREYLKAFETRTLFESEYRLKRADGEYRWVLDRGAPHYLPDGSFAGFIGSCLDITERRLAADSLAEQAALIDAARDAIMAIDMNGDFIYWNKSADRLFGWSREETIGRPASEILPGIISGATWGVLREQGEWAGELTLRRKGQGEVIVDSHKTLVYDKAGRPKSVLIVQTDIGERKKLELKFLRAQRLESVGGLASGIAHDLNNILTPLVMSSDLLADTVRDPAGKKLVEMLQVSAQRGGDLVKQILAFSRGADGERKPVMLRYTIKELGTLIRETFPRSIRFQTSLAPDLWKVMGNATQLHQVLMNLAMNARDAMADGGLLSISARNVPMNSAPMTPDVPPGQYVLLTVTDEGCGIRPEVLSRIFEPFFTTKEPGKGTGLGLSTVWGIVKGHGGFIDVQSTVGKGTCFRVLLPALSGEVEVTSVNDSPDLPSGQNDLILVVDDELAIRQITKLTLEAYGYRVLLASDGSEAISLNAQYKGSIKLVITDTMMPVLDGPLTVRSLKQIDPNLKFIAVSGMALTEQVSGYDRDITLLLKPYTTQKLVTTVFSVLHPPVRPMNPTKSSPPILQT